MRDLLELYQKGRTAHRLAGLHELVEPILEELMATLGYERAFVALIDTDLGVVDDATGVNPPEELIEELKLRGDEPPNPLVQSLQSGRAVRVDDALRDPRVPESKRGHFADFGMATFAAIPLLPASSVLVVSKASPIVDAELADLLPFAARLVTALVEPEEAQRLRESGHQHAVEKEWLWWMANAVQDPIVLSDEENTLILKNTSAERLFQINPDDSPGRRYAIELNNFLLMAALSSFTLDQGAAPERELTLVDPVEGGELFFEVICKPATNLRTGASGLVSVLKDVTDLRRADEEVQRSLSRLQAAGEAAQRERDRLNLILENVGNPIVVTDPTGQIILMNQPAARLLQSRDERPSERTAAIYRANAKLSSFLSQLRMEAAQARHDEIQLVDPDTEESLTLSVVATEVRDELGQVTAVVAVLHDLTKIRELERRTVEQQLFESEKLAAVGRLAAAVAHEINNPLEAIINALYLVVSRTPEEDPNRRFLDIANRETQRVSGIIRQMLGFYRPKAGKAPIDVNLAIEETLALLARQLRQHRVTVRSDMDEGLPRVLGSTDQLKQVFLNLLLNAQEAMASGGTLTISTRLSRETDPEFLAGRYVLVQIRDTGAGISEEHLLHIFEPFYSTKRDSKGTGLGLWVSLGIVQNHGGQLKVRSRAGRGTTFTIALPPEGSS